MVTNSEGLLHSHSSTNEIYRTPAGQNRPRSLSVSSSSRVEPLAFGRNGNSFSPPATRSSTAKSSFRYIPKDGGVPNVTNIAGYIVLLDGSITEFEGPVFGIVGEPVTVQGKRSSQRLGYYIRELFGNTVGPIA